MIWRVHVFLLSAAVLLTPGCASLHFMNSQDKIPEAGLATCQRLNVTPTKYILTVNIATQTAKLFERAIGTGTYWHYKFANKYPCSTSRFGIGEIKDSNCTPRGLHRIAEKIGDGEPAGTIFKQRKVVGRVSELGEAAGGITTRIMWLEGLEPGFNCRTNGAVNVDTHDREIYIHG